MRSFSPLDAPAAPDTNFVRECGIDIQYWTALRCNLKNGLNDFRLALTATALVGSLFIFSLVGNFLLKYSIPPATFAVGGVSFVLLLIVLFRMHLVNQEMYQHLQGVFANGQLKPGVVVSIKESTTNDASISQVDFISIEIFCEAAMASGKP